MIVEVVVILRCLCAAKQFAKREEVLNDLGFLLVLLRRTLICHGTHDLLGHRLLVIAEVETVAFGLTHLTCSVQTRHFHRLVREMERSRLFEILDVIDAVETARKETSHLHVLLLILTHRHFVRLVHQNIRCHQTRVRQQTGIHIIRLFAHFLLKGGHALQLTQIGVHIQIQIQFQDLFDIALHVNRCFLGINTASEVLAQNGLDRFTDVLRRRMCGQRMPVSYEKHAVILVLHLHKTLDGSEIITQMQISRRTYTTNNSLHDFNWFQSVTDDK